MLPLGGLGIVRAADDDKTLLKIHILSPEAEQLAVAHSGVDGGRKEIAPLIGYVKKQERNFLGA